MRHWLLALTLLLVLFAPAAAQQPPMQGTLPDSIVVTATRSAVSARQTGRRVTVWTARDLAALPVSSFDELLRTVGGVEAQTRGGFGVQSDLTMRGSTFNGVLLLLDGVRLNDPMTGHFISDLPVPLSEIARIEVLRGPAASLYGPDALGGVIQIFTYAGLYSGEHRPGATTEIRAEGGANALYHADGAVRYRTKQTLFSGAVTASGTDGEAIYTADGTRVRDGDEPVSTDFRRSAATLATTHAFAGGSTLLVRAGLDDRDFNAYQFYTGFSSDRAREATRTYWLQTRLRGRLAERTGFTVESAYKQHRDAYTYNAQVPTNTHISRLATIQARASHRLSTRIRVTAGASTQLRGIDSNVMEVHSDVTGGVFGLLRATLAPGFTATLGSRLDVDQSYGAEATPQLSLAYTQDAVTLRGNVGRAVRAPNYVERYMNAAGNFGNPDLDAERAWAAEAGVDVFPLPGASVHATVFARRTDNLIDYALMPGEERFVAQNVLEVDTRGLELDVEADRRLGAARLRLTGTYTYLDSDLTTPLPDENFKYVLGHARQLLQSTATVGLGRVSLGLQGLWKDRLEQDRYALVHARLGYRLSLGASLLRVSAEVRNVFDADVTEIFAAPLPGRWWLVGVSWAR